ncbi:hypothetical protein T492DRAFT_1141815 [Pavlovales sp. CCMP2436]|nr:hypothetical protein T492DRAFT_1141815 [Pavlovales sp. CCMP2436]
MLARLARPRALVAQVPGPGRRCRALGSAAGGVRVPTLELEDLLPGAPLTARASALEALRCATSDSPGFFALRVPRDVLAAESIAQTYALSRQFFSLPAEAKRRYHVSRDERGRGWTGSGEEPAYELGTRSAVEAYDIGRELCVGGSNGDPAMGPNVWPRDELPEFELRLRALYDSMTVISQCLFGAFAESLGLPEDSFRKHATENSRATMRLLRYPPQVRADGHPSLPPPFKKAGERWPMVAAAAAGAGAGGNVGIGAHTDFECFTMMHQSAPGLQLRPLGPAGSPGAEWIDAPPTPPDTLIVIVGDMLERFSNGTLCATEHRVPQTDWERFSLIQFNGLASDAIVSPLPQFGPPRYSTVTQGEHMSNVYQSLNAGLGAQGTAQWNGGAQAAPGASPDWQPYDYKSGHSHTREP